MDYQQTIDGVYHQAMQRIPAETETGLQYPTVEVEWHPTSGLYVPMESKLRSKQSQEWIQAYLENMALSHSSEQMAS